MSTRRKPLLVGQIYHIFSKSISGYKIFRDDDEYERMKDLLKYYRTESTPMRFSIFQEIKYKEKKQIYEIEGDDLLVEIIAYCIMPTHFHLVVKQLKEDGISFFIQQILNSYSRYFNIKTKRKGPLWEGRFQNVVIETDEQLLHLTRYIHLNPVTAYLVNRPEDWKFSSYREFLGEEKEKLSSFSNILDTTPDNYKKFVDDRIDYQRQLAEIKKLVLE